VEDRGVGVWVWRGRTSYWQGVGELILTCRGHTALGQPAHGEKAWSIFGWTRLTLGHGVAREDFP